MYKIQIDHLSPFTLRLPKRLQQNKVVTLARKFVAYEQILPLEDQTPYTESIANLLAVFSADRSAVNQGEGQRQTASEAVKKADRKAKRLIKQMAKIVGGFLDDTPSEAYQWGFRVRQSTGNLLLPHNRAERLALLEVYIAQEESRPEAERFPVPSLSQVQQVKEYLTANLTARDTAQTQRESGVIARNGDSQRLMEYLQLAAAHIIGVRYEFKISPELERWGFEVVAKRGASQPDETQAEAATQEAATVTEPTDQDSVAPSNGVHYEAEQNGSYQAEPSMVNGSG